jgi:hypothetical protein
VYEPTRFSPYGTFKLTSYEIEHDFGRAVCSRVKDIFGSGEYT